MNQTATDYRNLLEAGRDLHRYATRFGFDRVAYVQSMGAYFSDRADGAPGATRWTPVSIISEEATSSVAIVDLPAHCPIGRYCLTHDKPFAWRYSDEQFFKPDADDAPPATSVGKFMRRFHVGGAVTTPLHSPPGVVGIVSWLTSDPSVNLQALVERKGSELELHGRRFLQVAKDFSHAHQTPSADALTPRELECLRWTALGKTTDEIGELISRSGETARFHLKSAIRKLGASNRIHAVARAAYYGLLGDVS
jgi:DNA-binding CsgD family transcriptional regulator